MPTGTDFARQVEQCVTSHPEPGSHWASDDDTNQGSSDSRPEYDFGAAALDEIDAIINQLEKSTNP